jgi:hypothetical protein
VDTRLSNALNYSKWPSISVSGSGVHIAWEDRRSGNYEIFYKRSTDEGKSWGPDTLLSDSMVTMSERPSIAVSDSIIHVVWADKRDGPNGEIYYKRNPTGNITGINDWSLFSEHQIKIYPNPADDILRIVSEFNSRDKIQIYSILGNMVLETEYQNAINVSMLPEGVYYMIIISGNEKVVNKFNIIR